MRGAGAVAVWAALAAASIALQLRGVLVRRAATIGDFFAVVMRPWPGRVVVLGGWLWLGWHVFVRTTPG